MSEPTILLLPGLGNSGPDHWQTHWEAEFPCVRVTQEDWDTPRVEDWVDRLHSYIVGDSSPKILVAHSLACALVSHWAHKHHGPVSGALLVAPSDVEGPNYPAGPIGFAPMPLDSLAFRSLVVASDDDLYVPIDRGLEFAKAWGSDYLLLGSRGHMGSAAKLGKWMEGRRALERLLSGTISRQAA